MCVGVPAQGRASGGGQRLREDVRVHVPWMAVRCAYSCTMPCTLSSCVAVWVACILPPAAMMEDGAVLSIVLRS